MNKFIRLLFLITLFFGSIILYAINTEYVFTNKLFSNFLSRSESKFTFTEDSLKTTLATNENSIFSDDFETAKNKWTFYNNDTNNWVIGTAAKNTGTKGMYISNDKGVTNIYSNVGTVIHAVSSAITVPLGTVDAELYFDWRAEGESLGTANYDFGEVWIIPSTYTPIAGTKLTAGTSGGIKVRDALIKQQSFKSDVTSIAMSKFAGKSVHLVFQWVNDTFTTNQPALAIDNINILAYNCSSIEGFELGNTNENSIDVKWIAPAQTGKQVELYMSTNTTPPTGNSITISAQGNTHLFSSLMANTQYYIWYRGVCGINDNSVWSGPLQIRTLCSSMNLPFWEGFNKDSNTITCWAMLDLNQDSTSSTSNGIWKPSSTNFEGDQSMYFYGSTSDPDKKPHNDWLISPVFNYTPNKTYRLKYHYRTDSKEGSEHEFEVLLSDTGGDSANFTKVIVPKKKYPNSTVWTEEYLFFTGVSNNFQLAWHITSASNTTSLYIDKFSIEEITSCPEPSFLEVSNITDNSATIDWTDNNNSTSWQYYVQSEGMGLPNATLAINVNQPKVNVFQDNMGNLLLENSTYEYFVRANCGNGEFSEWSEPYKFTTKCSPITNLPFEETFNTNSTTYDCWEIVNNRPNSIPMVDTWQRYNYNQFEGDRTMYFAASGTPNDDWLITPTFEAITGEIYEITYYYRSTATANTEYEVLLSTKGRDLDNFTRIIMPSKKVKIADYIKATHYVTGVTGNFNLAFHVNSNNYSIMYLDQFRIEKVNCAAPDENVTVTNITAAEATLKWEDAINNNWEFAIVAAGATTPKVGVPITSKSHKATQTTGVGGSTLQPNTEYDFYVRSSCGGTNKSKWIGPIYFRTSCLTFATPYQQGFNTGSTSLSCWTPVNGADPSSSYNYWRQDASVKFEGTDSYYYYGNYFPSRPHNAWLVSPIFDLAPNKYYSLRYHYRTSDSFKTNVELLSSNSGSHIDDFKTILVEKTEVKSAQWKEVRMTIGGGTGEAIAFAWHITGTDTYANFYIDNFFLEEINCPEPFNLSVTNLGENSATLNWIDDFGEGWEHYVQEVGKGTPLATTKGTATKVKNANINKTTDGTALIANTEYEFYVRTVCTNDETIWIGPYKFFTLCSVLETPFWEGFNADSETIRCWEIIDGNQDSTSDTGNNIWRLYDQNPYEGAYSMYFYGQQSDEKKRPHDDWVISPKIKYTAGKTYRLKYHYRTMSTASYDYEFEVLLSDTNGSTASFDKTLVAKKKYPASTDWVEEYLFFTAPTADFRIAWHVTSVTPFTYLYIDNIIIEEVEGCPEPLISSLSVKDIGKKQVNLLWDDKFNATTWEYYIVEAGFTKPTNTDKGLRATKKEVIATKDGKGNDLKGNTDYEFYIRTDCGNGEYSIWSDPFKFTTLCDYYEPSFWEGFNTGDVQYRCWSTMNKEGDIKAITTPWSFDSSVHEGDKAVSFTLNNSTKTPFDDWLISPEIKLDGGQYVLKYHYKTNTVETDNPEFEVVLSTNGIDAKEFKKVLVPSTVKRVGNYIEEVVFFSGVKGVVNIAWHVNAKNTQYSFLYLDNITLKKITTCPEPYEVKINNQTSTTANVSWVQAGGINNWEVIVVDYGEPVTAIPVQTVQVTGAPNVTLTNLSSSSVYTVYVIAKCNDVDTSDSSTGVEFITVSEGNFNCGSAITIPVSKSSQCLETVNGTLLGASTSLPAPDCSPGLMKDIWFEFTAIESAHMLSISNLLSLSGQELNLNVALYEEPCSAILIDKARECFTLNSDSGHRMIRNLVPGQKYLLRLGVASTIANPDLTFKLCLRTPQYVNTSSQPYTNEQLVKEVLVASKCDLVSNIQSSTGSDFGDENGIGYFTNESDLFPFKEGIVLTTTSRSQVSGPTIGGFRANSRNWLGDSELDKLLIENGQTERSLNASVLEFDFMAIVEEIEFNFLFASDEYSTYQCGFTDVFAFFLTDLTTNETVNLAVIPDTNTPVSVTTIRDGRLNSGCESLNVEYFGNYFDTDKPPYGLPRELNPTSFKGITKPMVAKSKVQPGRKYHIKLAIANYYMETHQSAVFLEGGSFNLGMLDLGADLTVDNGTALCNGEEREINSGLIDGSEVGTIEWYRNDVLLKGETQPMLTVSEAGTYKIIAHYKNINCEIEGEIYVETLQPINEVVNTAVDINICRYGIEDAQVDLNDAVISVFDNPNINNKEYELAFFEDLAATILIKNPASYTLDSREQKTIYYKITDLHTGCEEIFQFNILVKEGDVPIKPKNELICESYMLPEIKNNQMYYTKPGAQGTAYKGGDLLGPGIYELYLFQDNGDTCYEEESFTVEITERIPLITIADQVLECEVYVLPELLDYYKYFIDVDGERVELPAGNPINISGTRIYIVAESSNKICYDETSFTVTYNECPIPKGFSPNGDGINDNFDLTQHGVTSVKIFNRSGNEVYSFQGLYTNQWTGLNKNDKPLPSGTYYYVIQSFDKTRTGWVQIQK